MVFHSPENLQRLQYLPVCPARGARLLARLLPVRAEARIIFVDVGGALGSEIKELRKRYPALEGRMILQDRQQTIDQVSSDPRMDAMVHDFFTPQPVTGTTFQILPLKYGEQSSYPEYTPVSPANAHKLSVFITFSKNKYTP